MKFARIIGVILLFFPLLTSALTFSRPLIVGSRGTDVSSLQQILKSQGYYSGDITGFLGPLTAKSLASFQKAHNIEALGGVGPKTRTLLNTLSAVPASISSAGGSCVGPISITRFLTKGSKGADVTQLQRTLVSLNFLTADSATGFFGNLTTAAVKAFQTSKGFEPVGATGPKTRAALGALKCVSKPQSPVGQATSTPPTSGGGGIIAGAPSVIQNYTPPIIGGGSGGGGAAVPPFTPNPTLTFSTNVPSITQGGSAAITWSTANATGCTASGAWNGTQSTSGSQSFTNITTTSTYTLTCAGAGGSISQSVTITVVPPPIPPDTTAPIISNAAPVGTLVAGTINSALTVTTDESATCAYSTSNTSFTSMTPFPTTGGTSHTASLTGLSNSTSYTYYVSCKDTAGNISPNTTVNFSVATPATPAPNITISANPTNVTWSNASIITWSSINASSCTASGGWSGTKATSGSQQFTNLTANQTYTLQCSGAGGSATQSANVTVTGSAPDTTPPSTPSGLSGNSISQTQINLTWSASTDNVGVTGYQVFRNGTQVGSPTTNSYSDTGLTASTQYTYTVKAVDAANNASALSNSTNVITQAVVVVDTTPPSVSITAPTTNLAANTTQTTLSVTTNENASCKYSTSDTTYAAMATTFTTTGVQSHSTTLASLTNGTSYTYYVRCSDTAGNADPASASVSFAVATPPDAAAPTVPTNVSATAISSSQINLTWTASTDAAGVTGYQVFRNGTQVGSPSTNSYSDTGLTASTLYSYTVTAADAAGNVSAASAAASATTPTGVVSGGGGNLGSVIDAYGTTWKPVRIGAGGWLVGMDIVQDGTMVVRTDTYGAYWWNGSQWQQLVTSLSMPAADVFPGNSYGVFEIRIAPSNSSRFYMEYMGNVYRSDNKGGTWIKTAFPHDSTSDANDNYRMWGQKMAVDPANPDVVYAGTTGNGMWVSSDAGSTWQKVTAIPAATAGKSGVTGIVFDASSGSVGGKTKVIFASSYGNGVYRSSDAGLTWTALTGGPSSVSHAKIASDGAYYASGNDGASVWRYMSGVWTNITPSADYWGGIIVDPLNPAHIVAIRAGGYLDASFDRGATWTGVMWTHSGTATDVPWLGWINNSFMSEGEMYFDPSVPNKIWFSWGYGFSYTTVSPSATWQTPTVWVSQSAGVEQLVATEIISPPGGSPLAGVEDNGIFTITNPDVYPSVRAPSNLYAQTAAWSLDWASTNPSYIAAIMAWDHQQSGYSTDGGQTWQSFASAPPWAIIMGGTIAASTPQNIVWVGTDNQNAYYTKDGGTTWTQLVAPGAPTSGETGWGFNQWVDRQIVAADRVTPNTFYLYNYLKGLYRSVDGGSTWALIKSGELAFGSGWNAKLRSVPGYAGQLFFTSGPQGNASDAHPYNSPLMRTVDAGVTWTAVPNVKEVYDIGFGKSATPGGYPTLYIVGYVNNMYGAWRSTDNAQTWVQVGKWPYNSLDFVRSVSGDMNIFGRMYVGFIGSSYVYGDTSGTVIPVQYTLTTSAGANGSISPGNTMVSSGSSQTFTIAANSGYKIASVSVDGVSQGAVGTYTFSNVAANHTIAATFTVGVDTTAPSIPSGVAGVPVSSSQINLTWTASTDNVGVTGYKIYRNGTQVGTSATTNYFDTGLTASTAYSYAVAAYDAAGNTSAQSSASSVTTLGAGQVAVVFTPTDNPPIQFLNFTGPPVTFSNVNIGTPASNRIVVVGVDNNSANGDGGTTGVTIGGVAATKAVDSETGSNYASLWYALVPTGTTANVVVTTGSSGIEDVGILVGNLTGAALAPTATATHPSGNIVADPQRIPTTGTITVPAAGAAVIFARGSDAGASTINWTGGATGDYYTHTSSWNGSSALMAHSTNAGAQSFTVAGSVGNGFGYGGLAGVVAVWGPGTISGDITAPSVPNGVSANAVSSSQINLTWTASTDAVGVTGYKIYRAGTQVGTSASTNYSDSGLSASTAYSYTVAAYDAAGNTSGQSSSASATTQTATDTTPPQVIILSPSGVLSSTAAALSVSTNEPATCAWSNTSGTTFASMTSFTTTGNTTHQTNLPPLTNGSSYTTYVKCKDATGNTSTDVSTSYSVQVAQGGGGGGGGSVVFTPTDNPPIQFLGFTGPVVTFSNVNIGTPSANRVVVVGVDNNSANNDGGTTAVTIGGIAATKAVTSNAGSDFASLWYATVPTGTTANVVVTTGSVAIENLGILVGTITGASSPAPVTTAVHPSGNMAADPQSIPTTGTITVPTGGVAVIFGQGGSNGAGTPTWTGATGDYYTYTTQWNTSSALMAHTYQAGAQSFTLTGFSGNGFGWGGLAAVVAAWGP